MKKGICSGNASINLVLFGCKGKVLNESNTIFDMETNNPDLFWNNAIKNKGRVIFYFFQHRSSKDMVVCFIHFYVALA